MCFQSRLVIPQMNRGSVLLQPGTKRSFIHHTLHILIQYSLLFICLYLILGSYQCVSNDVSQLGMQGYVMFLIYSLQSLHHKFDVWEYYMPSHGCCTAIQIFVHHLAVILLGTFLLPFFEEQIWVPTSSKVHDSNICLWMGISHHINVNVQVLKV